MDSIIIKSDGVYKRYGDALQAIGNRDARQVFARALNRGGDQGRTQVKRSLVAQTGIKYGLINKTVKTVRAQPNRLVYTLEASGSETNLKLFGASQTARGVSASPWGKRHMFKSAFIIQSHDGKVFKREGKGRGSIKPLFGPNIAREIVKDQPPIRWEQAAAFVMSRVEYELARLFQSS